MATTGQWEVVGKPAKKGKSTNHLSQKNQKKVLRENMPKIETAPPVKESATIYDAFLAKTSRSEKADKEQISPNGDATSANMKKHVPKKKVANGEKKKEILTLEQALQKIEYLELEALLTKDQTTFPDNPSVWLKDLASILNIRLDRVPEADPVFEGKPKDYPLCMLPKSVRQLLVNTLSQCSTHTLELFLEHCLQCMTNDIGKSISTYGYRMFIQLIAFDKPDIVIASLKKTLNMLKTHQNRPLRCLSIMWAVGQAGNKNLANGLKVWMEVMLPVLNIRALQGFAVDYLENLFKIHKNLKTANNVIIFRNFFPILDLIFATQPNLPTNLQKKLMNLYPKLKAISFGNQPESNLRNFFPSFLARITPSANKHMRAEVLQGLVECLVVDKHSFSVWRQMYTKHLTPSSSLLQHIVENWDTVSKRIDRKILRETIRAFNITNDELSTHGHGSGDGYQQCVSSCKELLDKMSTMRFPWRTLLFLLMATLAGIISYDVVTSGAFKKSKTAKLLKDAGLLVFFEQVWNRIRVYTGKAVLWLQENVPHYYAKACEFAGPYLHMFWEKLYAGGIYIAEVTKPHRDWLNVKIPQLLEWMHGQVPWLWSGISHYLGVAWEYTVYCSLWIWHHLVHYTHTTGTWLQENVFTGNLSGENIQKTLSSSMATVQSYSSSFVEWCMQMWAGGKK